MKTLKFEINKAINKEKGILEVKYKKIGFSSQAEEKYCQGRISAFQSVLNIIEDGVVVE